MKNDSKAHGPTYVVFGFLLFGMGSSLFSLFSQYNLPLELINRQNLTEWMEILKTVVDRDVPPVRNLYCLILISNISIKRLSV